MFHNSSGSSLGAGLQARMGRPSDVTLRKEKRRCLWIVGVALLPGQPTPLRGPSQFATDLKLFSHNSKQHRLPFWWERGSQPAIYLESFVSRRKPEQLAEGGGRRRVARREKEGLDSGSTTASRWLQGTSPLPSLAFLTRKVGHWTSPRLLLCIELVCGWVCLWRAGKM